jgi:flagellin
LDGSLANSAVTAISERAGSSGGANGAGGGGFSSAFSPLPGTTIWKPSRIDKNINPKSPHWLSGGGFPVTNSYQGSPTSKVYIDFSSVSLNVNKLDGKGISIACGTCSQYVTMRFDRSIDSTDSTVDSSKGYPEYTIGIKDVRSMSGLAKAIFVGVGSANNEPTGSGDTVTIDNGNHNISMYFDSAAGKYVIEKNANPLQFYAGIFGEDPIDDPDPEPEEVFFGYDSPLKIHHGPHANQSTSFYVNDLHTKSLGTGVLFHEDISKLSDYERIIDESDREMYDSLDYDKRLQNKFIRTLKGFTPPRYADNIEDLPVERRIVDESDRARYHALSYDDDMQQAWVETLKSANSKTLDDIDVITKQNANTAIRVIDNAISYALNESTRIGSYLQRLEYTDANIITMNENVQGAESTIRDADMAKEMTEYTKFNVLTQASQSMLAQANQNASSVLSLLQ